MAHPGRLLLALLLPLAACKGDAASDSVDSGIDTAKQGKELTPGEQNQLCEAAIGYLEQTSEPDFKTADCHFHAVFNAALVGESVAECEARFDGCLAEPEDEPEPCSFGPVVWSECTATVAEIEACFTEWMDQTVAFTDSLSCDKVAEYSERWPGEDNRLGPACKAARAICPDLVPNLDMQ